MVEDVQRGQKPSARLQTEKSLVRRFYLLSKRLNRQTIGPGAGKKEIPEAQKTKKTKTNHSINMKELIQHLKEVKTPMKLVGSKGLSINFPEIKPNDTDYIVDLDTFKKKEIDALWKQFPEHDSYNYGAISDFIRVVKLGETDYILCRNGMYKKIVKAYSAMLAFGHVSARNVEKLKSKEFRAGFTEAFREEWPK